MIVSRADLKAHLRYTDTDQDTLIDDKIAAAQRHVESWLGYSIETRYPDAVPDALKECVRQLAAHWFENREASIVGVSAQPLPLGCDDIIAAHRDWSF